jgi:hypothetical protein
MKKNPKSKNFKQIKNKVLKAARTPMCASKVHMDRKKQAKKTGEYS